jgi:exosome complex protein LRP1
LFLKLVKNPEKLDLKFFSIPAIQKIQDLISSTNQINFDELTIEEKVKYDLFLCYSINSLYWMYLKMNGEDPNSVSYFYTWILGSPYNPQFLFQHGIKNELTRIKEVMLKEKQIHDKKFRPLVNQEAAKRFVRGGLYDHQKKNEEFRKKREEFKNPPNKRKRFD